VTEWCGDEVTKCEVRSDEVTSEKCGGEVTRRVERFGIASSLPLLAMTGGFCCRREAQRAVATSWRT
jgi:hypothetical protein